MSQIQERFRNAAICIKHYNLQLCQNQTVLDPQLTRAELNLDIFLVTFSAFVDGQFP